MYTGTVKCINYTFMTPAVIKDIIACLTFTAIMSPSAKQAVP